MSIGDPAPFVLIVATLCVVLLLGWASNENIRDYRRKKRAEANGGEEYVSTAWTGSGGPLHMRRITTKRVAPATEVVHERKSIPSPQG